MTAPSATTVRNRYRALEILEAAGDRGVITSNRYGPATFPTAMGFSLRKFGWARVEPSGVSGAIYGMYRFRLTDAGRATLAERRA